MIERGECGSEKRTRRECLGEVPLSSNPIDPVLSERLREGLSQALRQHRVNWIARQRNLPEAFPPCPLLRSALSSFYHTLRSVATAIQLGLSTCQSRVVTDRKSVV